MIGEVEPELSDPWFIRDLRSQRQSASPDLVARKSAEPDFPKMKPFDGAGYEPPHVDSEAGAPSGGQSSKPHGLRSTFLAIGGAALVAILLVLFGAPRVDGPAETTAVPQRRAAAATRPRAVESSLVQAASLQCAQPQTLALLRELIVEAGVSAGAERERLDRQTAGLSLSVTGTPVEADINTVASRCTGWLTLQKPASAGKYGSAEPLVASVSYQIRLPADGHAGITAVQGIAPAVEELVRVARAEPGKPAVVENASPPARAVAPAPPAPSRADDQLRVAVTAPRREQTGWQERASEDAVRDSDPSFDCDRVTSRVNQMICASPGLSALDSRMSQQFNEVADRLDPVAQRELEASRRRFLKRKMRCLDEACIEGVYLDRIDEIDMYRNR